MKRRMFQVIVLAGLVGAIVGWPVRAEEKKADQPKEKPMLMFDGEITKIDKTESKLTILKFPVSKTFQVPPDCKITITDKPEAALRDLEIGNKVKVKYEDAKDTLVARSIIIRGIDEEDRKDAKEQEKLERQ